VVSCCLFFAKRFVEFALQVRELTRCIGCFRFETRYFPETFVAFGAQRGHRESHFFLSKRQLASKLHQRRAGLVATRFE
jgi:hypothetical protein